MIRIPSGGGRAARRTAQVFGVLAGLGGLTHGVGEVIQGAVPVRGLFLDSWTTGPIAAHMGGEPGLTLLPTASSAGIATLVLSTAVVGWSAAGMRRPRGGSTLMALSAGMLLAGGGVGPPVMGLLAGAIGRWASRSPRWVTRVDERLRRALGRVWAPLFAVATANATFLVIGSLVLVYGFDVDRPELFERSFYAAALSLLALAATAPAADAEHRAAREEPVEPAAALLGASQGSV